MIKDLKRERAEVKSNYKVKKKKGKRKRQRDKRMKQG